MDSVIGAICLGYYYTKKLGSLWVPVINCNKKEFFYNLEIVLHLNDCQIDLDDLFYYDEYKATYTPDKVTEVALVDHNILDVNQAEVADKVTRVIDHHYDAQAYKETLVEKECCFVGSACALVALKIAKDEGLFKTDLTPGQMNFATLLGAAVVLDSYNFKEELRDKKWNQLDIDAHAFLSKFADLGTQYWSRLNAAKFDVEGALKLGLRGIFTRDYKCYELKDGLKGCAVATASFETLLNHFGKDEVANEIEKLI